MALAFGEGPALGASLQARSRQAFWRGGVGLGYQGGESQAPGVIIQEFVEIGAELGDPWDSWGWVLARSAKPCPRLERPARGCSRFLKHLAPFLSHGKEEKETQTVLGQFPGLLGDSGLHPPPPLNQGRTAQRWTGAWGWGCLHVQGSASLGGHEAM